MAFVLLCWLLLLKKLEEKISKATSSQRPDSDNRNCMVHHHVVGLQHRQEDPLPAQTRRKALPKSVPRFRGCWRIGGDREEAR